MFSGKDISGILFFLLCGCGTLLAQIAPNSNVILTVRTPLLQNGAIIRNGEAGETFRVVGVNSQTKTILVSVPSQTGDVRIASVPEANVAAVDPTPSISAVPNNPIEAKELATQFKNDRTAAQKAYEGKELTITGEIERFETMGGVATGTGPIFFLATGAGLPKVRIALIPGLSNDIPYRRSVRWWIYIERKASFRIINDTLQARQYSNRGDFITLLTKGQPVKIRGTCSGMMMDVRIDAAQLLRN